MTPIVVASIIPEFAWEFYVLACENGRVSVFTAFLGGGVTGKRLDDFSKLEQARDFLVGKNLIRPLSLNRSLHERLHSFEPTRDQADWRL